MLFRKKNLIEARIELEEEEKQWAQEKKLLDRVQVLKSEQEQYKEKRKKISTSKLLILFLFINCSLIELFTGWATIKMLDVAFSTGLIDFTPLVALIGAVVGEVLGYAIYSLKAAKENTLNGITYMTAQYELEQKKKQENIDNVAG
jgi:hypothetical protein